MFVGKLLKLKWQTILIPYWALFFYFVYNYNNKLLLNSQLTQLINLNNYTIYTILAITIEFQPTFYLVNVHLAICLWFFFLLLDLPSRRRPPHKTDINGIWHTLLRWFRHHWLRYIQIENYINLYE